MSKFLFPNLLGMRLSELCNLADTPIWRFAESHEGGGSIQLIYTTFTLPTNDGALLRATFVPAPSRPLLGLCIAEARAFR